jgi:hypothetical protein
MRIIKILLMITILSPFLMSSSVCAGELTIPNDCVSGEVASASDMNANFTAIEQAVNDNDSRITALENKEIVTVIDTSDPISPGSFGVLKVLCPTTHPIAIGGGIDLENISTMVVTSSAPTVGETRIYVQSDGQDAAPDGWQASARNNDSVSKSFKVAVICSQ